MVQVLDKAFNILELLASDATREFSLGEISGALGLDKATCSNILKTLCSRGYVEQAAPRKGYKLGHMAYRLGDSFDNNEKLTFLSKEIVNDLCRKTNECVLLSVIRLDKRVALITTIPDQDLFVQTSREIPAYRATTGRVILSYYSSEEMVRFVRLHGLPKSGDWEGVDSYDNLLTELEKTRRQGWRIDINRHHVVGLAVPVWKGNKVVASLGVYLPESRYRELSRRPMIPLLQEAAEKIRHLLSQGLSPEDTEKPER